MLQIEAMAQLSGSVALGRKLKDGEIVMLAAVDRVRFHRAAVPGDQLIITCELVRQLKTCTFMMHRLIALVNWYPLPVGHIDY